MAKRGKRSKKNRNKNKFKNNQTKMTIVKDKFLVAICGNMRVDGKEHKHLPDNSELIGIFYSEPIYKMIQQHGDAALFEKGKTSILFEVYEIGEKDMDHLDTQFGYFEDYAEEELTKDYNYHIRSEINTPFGKAFIYFYNSDYYNSPESPIIICGDWIEYLKETNFKKQIENN